MCQGGRYHAPGKALACARGGGARDGVAVCRRLALFGRSTAKNHISMHRIDHYILKWFLLARGREGPVGHEYHGYLWNSLVLSYENDMCNTLGALSPAQLKAAARGRCQPLPAANIKQFKA